MRMKGNAGMRKEINAEPATGSNCLFVVVSVWNVLIHNLCSPIHISCHLAKAAFYICHFPFISHDALKFRRTSMFGLVQLGLVAYNKPNIVTVGFKLVGLEKETLATRHRLLSSLCVSESVSRWLQV